MPTKKKSTKRNTTIEQQLERASARACQTALTKEVSRIAGPALKNEIQKIAQRSIKTWIAENHEKLEKNVNKKLHAKLDELSVTFVESAVSKFKLDFPVAQSRSRRRYY